MPDLDRLVSRMQKGKATLEDAIKIYTFVRRLPGLHQLLSECTGKYERTIQEKFTSQVEVHTSGVGCVLQCRSRTINSALRRNLPNSLR